MRKTIIGVMGPGNGATETDLQNAYQLGRLIAKNYWVLLTGGRNAGVMDAASNGAKDANGLTLGILPSDRPVNLSDAVDIAIVTGMGSARNQINVLSSDVVIACGIGAGTLSEIALALKANKRAILLNNNPKSHEFLKMLSPETVFAVDTPEAAIARVKQILSDSHI
ncbi:TIGR00725 family protein [Phormidium sp. CCY1219]|uniref:TIGR00725 family protein n=1 Tax=Phormidium sp. CCY1219 TaxID=2886104 RepID=UPI002D1E922E|nr:TIGR00725 family protein [Phormidium sp. CCY1219]MEB3831000.1 TIGR00725 family protein [Phormidium sp. CCY1219]